MQCRVPRRHALAPVGVQPAYLPSRRPQQRTPPTSCIRRAKCTAQLALEAARRAAAPPQRSPMQPGFRHAASHTVVCEPRPNSQQKSAGAISKILGLGLETLACEIFGSRAGAGWRAAARARARP